MTTLIDRLMAMPTDELETLVGRLEGWCRAHPFGVIGHGRDAVAYGEGPAGFLSLVDALDVLNRRKAGLLPPDQAAIAETVRKVWARPLTRTAVPA